MVRKTPSANPIVAPTAPIKRTWATSIFHLPGLTNFTKRSKVYIVSIAYHTGGPSVKPPQRCGIIEKMNSLALILGSAVGLPVACAAVDLLHVAVTRDVAFEEAKRLSNGKGIINLGAGPHRTYQVQMIAESPEILSNIDIVPNGMPHFLQLNLENAPLPFADKQFGCAFASHVLEHLVNWQLALAEMMRVADNVVVVVPDPIYFSGWLSPSHEQHFSVEEINEIAELYPEVTVYY
ncbi:hypothetical protein ES703_88769 [subsurface metagenome]